MAACSWTTTHPYQIESGFMVCSSSHESGSIHVSFLICATSCQIHVSVPIWLKKLTHVNHDSGPYHKFAQVEIASHRHRKTISPSPRSALDSQVITSGLVSLSEFSVLLYIDCTLRFKLLSILSLALILYDFGFSFTFREDCNSHPEREKLREEQKV